MTKIWPRFDISKIDVGLHRDRNHKIKIQLSAKPSARRSEIPRSFSSSIASGRRLRKLHRPFTVSRMIARNCRLVGMTGTICRCRSLRARFEKKKKIAAEVEREQRRRDIVYRRYRSDIITWFLYPRSFRHSVVYISIICLVDLEEIIKREYIGQLKLCCYRISFALVTSEILFCECISDSIYPTRIFTQWPCIIENDLNENSNLSIKKLKSAKMIKR